MTFPVYIYNTTSATLRFIDVGLEIPPEEYFEAEKADDLEKLYYIDSELYTAIETGDAVFSQNNENYPPLQGDLVPIEEIVTIVSPTTIANQIQYDDTTTNLQATNVQIAIEKLKESIGGGITSDRNFDGEHSNSIFYSEDTLNGGRADTDFSYLRIDCGTA